MKLLNNLSLWFHRWWDVGTINPERDEAKMPVFLLWVERFAILVVAVVSGIAIAAYGYYLASGYTSWEIVRWAAAIGFFALATGITDYGVKFFIQKAAFDTFASFNPETYKRKKVIEYVPELGKRHDRFRFTENGVDYVRVRSYTGYQRVMQVIVWVCMVAIIAGLFYFDYISVNSVRRPVANMVKKEETLNADSLRTIVIAQENARVGATVSAIEGFNVSIRQTEKAIEREKMAVVRSFGKDGMKLYRDNNGWFIKQRLEPAIARSKKIKSLNAQLETLAANKIELEGQQAKDLAYKTEVIQNADASYNATNAAINERNTNLVEGTSSMFIWLGFWAKCIAGLIRVLLVALFMAGNVQDYNGDGVTDYKDVNAAAKQGFLVD